MIEEKLSMRLALQIIADSSGGRCEPVIRPLGGCITDPGRSVLARYGAEQACAPCIAWLGLQEEERT